VLDVDDHTPHFERSVSESPMTMTVVEESPVGAEVGFVECFDEDIGDNANIDYVISGMFPREFKVGMEFFNNLNSTIVLITCYFKFFRR